MKIITLCILLFSLSSAAHAQKITVFENAPFIDTTEIQQMRNFAEFGDSYFYTSLSYAANREGDNVLVRVNKNTGKLESNDQKRFSTVAAWLVPTEKYIYYPNFQTKGDARFYTLKRFDPVTNLHEVMKIAEGGEVLFTSSLIRLAGLYSYRDSLVTTGTTEGLAGMPYTKYSSNLILDSAQTLGKTQIGYNQGPDHLFYTAQAPTENTLTINDDGLYHFVNSPLLKSYDLRLKQHSTPDTSLNYSRPNDETYLPFITSNAKRAFTLMYDKKEVKGEIAKISLVEFSETKGNTVAFFNIDRLSLSQDMQLAIAGDSIFVSDRWSMFEYNFKSKTIKQHLKLKPNERLYNVQNGKRFHAAPDGTIFYKKMTYVDKDETMGSAFVYALDKATSTSKQLFETKGSRNGDDLLKLHNARNNTYFIGNKAVDFKLNTQADKLDVLIYDKNGGFTNLPIPQIKKFKPSTGWYGKYFTAVQTKDSVVFNYGYQKDKKEEKIVVIKLGE